MASDFGIAHGGLENALAIDNYQFTNANYETNAGKKILNGFGNLNLRLLIGICQLLMHFVAAEFERDSLWRAGPGYGASFPRSEPGNEFSIISVK